MRLRLFAAALVATCALAVTATFSAARSATERIANFAVAVFLFVIEGIAGKPSLRNRFTPALALGGAAPSYDAPPIHALRHEAGTARRAADRHT